MAWLSRPTAQVMSRTTVQQLKPLRDRVYRITEINGKEFAGHRQTA